ncbi:LPP20 lipoprotein [Reichenbachiella faecimaris]|uniref:LPP20 lipoprotein n=1 Tax=Reichenbachiella faecimaris TaxID=692418 RepID=A0A1W2GNE7_REIFA|nr:LPP20 family lipoprotein [Reichenbachiella faecimaris]SMD37786.1 LPP20 lipoprotein [Reichenbachiella faecimaris]
MKINYINTIAIIGIIGLMVGCKGSPKPTYTKGESDVVLHCSGSEYRSDKKNFRAYATGESSDLEIARKKASSNAKAALAAQVETTVKSTTDNYVNSREFNNVEEIEERFESLNREVVDQQLNDVKVICEKLTENNKTGKYKCYMAVEMGADAIQNAIETRIKNDDRLKIDYDYEKFKETFEKEMEKMSNR